MLLAVTRLGMVFTINLSCLSFILNVMHFQSQCQSAHGLSSVMAYMLGLVLVFHIFAGHVHTVRDYCEHIECVIYTM